MCVSVWGDEVLHVLQSSQPEQPGCVCKSNKSSFLEPKDKTTSRKTRTCCGFGGLFIL